MAAKLEALAHRRRGSFQETLDDVLRRGLAARLGATSARRSVVEPHRGGFRPGIDPNKLNQLLDERDVQDFISEAHAWSSPTSTCSRTTP